MVLNRMAAEDVDPHAASGTRLIEVEVDSRLYDELVREGEMEGFDVGAELVAMALRELLRRPWPEQGRMYSAILFAMHEQAAALRAGSDVYEDKET